MSSQALKFKPFNFQQLIKNLSNCGHKLSCEGK